MFRPGWKGGQGTAARHSAEITVVRLPGAGSQRVRSCSPLGPGLASPERVYSTLNPYEYSAALSHRRSSPSLPIDSCCDPHPALTTASHPRSAHRILPLVVFAKGANKEAIHSQLRGQTHKGGDATLRSAPRNALLRD